MSNFKHGLMVGIGLASLAAKGARRRVMALIREGKITRRQGEHLLCDLESFAARKQKDVERQALAEAGKQLKAFRRVSRRQLARLRKGLESLERRL